MTRTLHDALVGLILAGVGLICVCAWAVRETVLIERAETAQLNVAIGTERGFINDQVTARLDAEQAQVNAILSSANDTVHTLNGALRTINHPCIPAPCGTLQDVARTLATIRGTSGQIENAARHENQRLGTLDQQEAQIAVDLHAAIGGLPAVESQGAAAFGSINTFMASPEFKSIAKNAASMSDSGARIAKDGADEADKLTHPPAKKMTAKAALWSFVEFIHKIEPPLF